MSSEDKNVGIDRDRVWSVGCKPRIRDWISQPETRLWHGRSPVQLQRVCWFLIFKLSLQDCKITGVSCLNPQWYFRIAALRH